MIISEVQSQLAEQESGELTLILPDQSVIPAHFHITEVGHLTREFIDCGGTIRTMESCLLQIWVADDVDHRVGVNTFLAILEHGKPVLSGRDMELEFEYACPYVSHFALGKIEIDSGKTRFHLKNKETDCLAKDVCGITEPSSSSDCCSGSGCC
ncbi:MAG: DUF6428 family protein [Verrucomicrobiota bacterium]